MGRGRKKAVDQAEVVADSKPKEEVKEKAAAKKAPKKRVFAKQDGSNPLLKLSSDEIQMEFIAKNDEILGGRFWDNDFVSTGDIVLDYLLGGGFPLGSVTEIFAAEGVGKTSLLIDTALGLQRAGFGSVIFDMEDGWKVPYLLQRGGVVNDKTNPASILLGKFETIEEVDIWMESLMLHDKIKMLVIDSFQGLIPQAILESRVGTVRPGLQAFMGGNLLIKMLKLAKRSGKALIVVSQLRTVFDFKGGNSGPQAAGGWALRFWATTRLELCKRGIETSTDNTNPLLSRPDVPYGHWVEGKTYKNRMTSPLKSAQTFLRYGQGFDNVPIIRTVATEQGLISLSGAWYSTTVGVAPDGEPVKFQGKEAMDAYIRANEELYLDELCKAGYDLRNPNF